MHSSPFSQSESTQFGLFKDALARRLLSHPAFRDSTGTADNDSGEVELDEFTSYLATEVWPSIPSSLRSASRESQPTLDLDALPLDATPLSFTDTLISYRIAPDTDDALKLLRHVTSDYIANACAPPPVWSSTRGRECEICERDVPLTYHHLIPRSTHAKAVKKKWHAPSMINSVAWLCR
jgi:hypothetical protein